MLRSNHIAPRGPPVVRNSPAGPATHASAVNPQDSPDVDVEDDDDDDDDDDAGDLNHSSAACTSGCDSILILSHVDDFRSFASHDNSLRAPPQ
jgi:hypothetical protein